MSDIISKGVFSGLQDADVYGIIDLDTRQINGVWHLYATTRAWAGITTFEVGEAGGLLFEARMPVQTYAGFPPTDHTFILAGGALYFQGTGRNLTQFDSYVPRSDGPIEAASSMSFEGGPTTSTLSVAINSLAGQTFAITSQFGSTTLQVYRQEDTDRFSLVSQTAFSDAATTRLATVTVTAQSYVFATTDATVKIFQLVDGGSLTPVFDDGAIANLGLSNPSHIQAVAMGDTSYLLVAGLGSSSLSVLQILDTGELVPTDHIIDDQSTRFAKISELAVVETNDRVFIAVAGSDDGFSLLELLPDGRLLIRDTVADALSTTLANVSGLAMLANGDVLHVYVSSETEAGITQFDLDIGPQGRTISGTENSETLAGADQNDVLFGAAGGDSIQGRAGEDILIDGAGVDILSGGTDADVFVFRQDGDTDTITDFETGLDRIDLSAFAQLRSIEQLLVTSTATGAEIVYAGETLIVDSQSGQSLTTSELGLDTALMLTRGVVPPRITPENVTVPDALPLPVLQSPSLYNFSLFSGGGSGAHIPKFFTAVNFNDGLVTGSSG